MKCLKTDVTLERMERAAEGAKRTMPRYSALIDSFGFDIGDYQRFGIDVNRMVIICPPTTLWDDEELIFVVLHEVLHLFKGDLYWADYFDPRLWQIAADLAINTLLQEVGLKIPRGCHLPENYGFEKGLENLEYIGLLFEKEGREVNE